MVKDLNAHIPHRKKRMGYVLLALVWSFLFIEYALRVSDSAIIPELSKTFHIQANGISVLSSFYYIPYVIMQIPAGILLDYFGIKKSLTFAVLVVAIGAFLISNTSHLGIALLARILMGIGSAFAFIGSVKILERYANKKFMALYVGISMTIATLGAVCGQEPWYLLTQLLGHWQHAYFAATIITLLIFIGMRTLTIPTETKTTINVAALKATLKSLLSKRNTWVVLCYVGLLSTPMTVFAALWGIPFFTQAWGLSRDLSTSLMTASWFGGLLGGPLLGYLADYFAIRKLMLVIIGITAAMILFVVLFVHLPWFIYAALLLVLGALCNGNVIVFAMMAELAPSNAVGFISGLTNSFNMGGGPIFQIIVGVLLSTVHVTHAHGFPTYPRSDYQHALVVLPILLLLLSIGVFYLHKNAGKQSPI